MRSSFKLFDATGYNNNAGLPTGFGFQRVDGTHTWIWEGSFTDPNYAPSIQHLADVFGALAKSSISPLWCFDIEPGTNNKWDVINDRYRDDAIKNWSAVFDAARKAAPEKQIGNFGLMPMCAPNVVIGYLRANMLDRMRVLNAAAKPLVDHVDFIAPQLYIPAYFSWADFERVAITVLQEAKQYGKPVYPFIWPQKFINGVDDVGNFAYCTYAEWFRVLGLCKKYADGAIVWGGFKTWNTYQALDESAPWWQATKNFINPPKLLQLWLSRFKNVFSGIAK